MNNQEQTNSIERISINSDGIQANGQSGSNSISDDGRFISFESNATNLVPDDFNGQTDTFIYDRLNESVELISIAPDGTQANGSSSSSSISGDGKYVAFASFASNLVSNDINNQRDIFVYNRINKTTELVSVATDGTQANGLSLFSAISDNGRYVAFESTADNLVSNDTNELGDIFVRDLVDKTTIRINLANDSTQANGFSSLGSISDDGRYITYESDASNLVTGDTNGYRDIFVYDLTAKTTQRINVTDSGIQANGNSVFGSISGDGRYITYESDASNLVTEDTNGYRDIFVYDRIESNTERVSITDNEAQSNGDSREASISDDGRYVAFLSGANDLVPEDTNNQLDIFIRDRVEQTTKQIEVDSFSILSGNGQSILFNSSLSNLVVDDTNDTGDVFVLDLNIPEVEEPVVEEPVVEEPVVEEPVVEEPVVDEPVVEEPVVEEPVVEEPVVEEPVVDEPVVDEPVVDEPVVEEPVVEEPVVDEPVVDEPVVEEPVVDEPVVEEPVVEEPVVEEPVVEEPVVEEPDLDRFTTDDVHRFYQFEKGFHLYTTDDNEIEVVRERSAAGELSYEYEAEKYTVLSDNKDALTGETLERVKPVYRFFNTQTGSHLYTSDENEKSFVEDTLTNYNFEGIKYYAFESEPTDIETIPVFRMLNNDTGSHLFTIDQNELNSIQENLPNFSFENNGDAVFHVFEL